MYLRAAGFSRFLYIEQENGRRLAVFDISRSARIKTVAEIELGVPSFEFLPAINRQFVLVRFNDSKVSSSLGVLDLKRPKKPVLRNLGVSAVFTVPFASPESQQRLGPLAGVVSGQHEVIMDEKLGSRFVLNVDGLWIIRQSAVEKDFELEEIRYYAD